MSNDVELIGRLDSSEIDKSIEELVRKVEQNTRKVANSFDGTISKIEEGMKGVVGVQSNIVAGIEAQIAANKELTESIEKLSKARKKGNKEKEKILSKSDVFAMPIDTEKAIDAKLKALEKLRKVTTLPSSNYAKIKVEYEKLQKIKEELLKTEEERQKEAIATQQKREKERERIAKEEEKFNKELAAEERRLKKEEEKFNRDLAAEERRLKKENDAAEKQRLKEEQQLEREIAKEEKERQKEKERLAKEAATAEKKRLSEIKKREKEITAEQKKRTASQKERGTRVADTVLGMHERDVSEMEEKIKLLKKHQEWLSSRGLLSQPKINQMTRSIDKLQEKVDKLKKSTYIPPKTNATDVFSMPETTIAEISAKMKVISKIRDNATRGSEELNRLNNEYSRLHKAQKEALSSGVKLEKQNNRLIKTFRNLGERVLFYFGLGAITKFLHQVVEIRAEYEMIERSIGILIDNMDKGTQVFRTLQDKAKKSPFTLIELGTATKQLSAYDFEAKDLVNTTNRLADISAALNVPIERLVYNLGQIKAQNVLNARDARDFANAGFAIVPMLAKMYSEQEKHMVSSADVYDRMKKKMVSYKDVLSVIDQATDEGGKFFDFQAKQAETLKVKIANLSLAYNDALNEMGKKGGGAIGAIIDGTKSLLENWRTIFKTLTSIVILLGVYKTQQIINNKLTKKQKDLFDEQKEHFTKTKAAVEILKDNFKGLKTAKKAVVGFFSNPVMLATAGLLAIEHFVGKAQEAKEKIEEFGNSLNEKAKSNAKSIEDFTSTYADKIKLIDKEALSNNDAEGLWDMYKEQIKQTAEEGDKLVKSLEGIEDVNKRLKTASDILGKFGKAYKTIEEYSNDITNNISHFSSEELTNGLKALIKVKERYEDRLKGNEEGLISNRRLEKARTNYNIEFESIKGYTKELSQFITDEIVKNGDKSQQVATEILAKNKNQFLKVNEGIRGEAADMFNIIVDEQVKNNLKLNKGWEDALIVNESLWNKLMQKLKEKHKNVFDNMTKNQLDAAESYEQLPEKAREAIDKSLNELIAEMPRFTDEIRDMVNKMNMEKLRINIGFTFNIDEPSRIQKYFNKMLLKIPFTVDREVYSKLEDLAPHEGEDHFKYAKRIQEGWLNVLEEEKQVNERNKGKTTSGLFGKDIKEIQETKKAYKIVSEEIGITLQREEKGRKSRVKNETELAKAIKSEISLIGQLNSSYDKMDRAGVKREKAIDTLNNLYKEQVNVINKIFKAHKLPTFDISKFAGKDVTAQTNYLTKLRNTMKSLGLDKDINAFKTVNDQLTKVVVDSKAFNATETAKRVEKFVNEVKKELDFSKELSKDKEMQTFFSVIGINTKNLPQTAEEAISKIQKEVSKAATENGLGVFDVLSTDLDKYAEGVFSKSSTLYKMFKTAQEQSRQLYKDDLKQKVEYLNEYIENYGTAQEKIYQIEKKYQYLIANEKDKNKRKSLIEERNNKVAEEKMREITKGIDWNVAMPEIGGIIRKVAKKVLDNLDTYMRSAQFKNLSADKQKAWYDLKNQLNKTTGGDTTSPFNFGIWGKIANQMQDWEKAIKDVTDAEIRHKEALELQKNAKTPEQQKVADDLVSTTEKQVEDSKNKVEKSQNDLTKSSEQATKGIQGFANAINEITNGSLYGLINGFSKLTTIIIDGTAKSLSELGGRIGGIVGAVLQILDALGSKSRETIDKMMDDMIHTFEGVIRDIPAIFTDIVVKDVPRIFGSAFDGVASWFGADLQGMFNNSNAKEIAEITKKLTESNERLQKSIEYLSDVVGESAGAKALFASDKAIEAQIEIDKNTRDKWIAQMNYHGSHHSNAYYFNDEYFSQWAEEIKKALMAAGLDEKNITSWADIQNLSAEEMAAIRAFAPTAFKYLEEVGEYDTKEYLNDFADLAGEIEKLENKMRENLTQTSFDSMRDSFLSALIDMEKSTKEFGEDFQEILFKSMVNKFVLDDEFDNALKNIYKDWADKLKTGDKGALKNFRQLIEDLFAEKKIEANALANGLGYKGGKDLNLSALQQGIQSITEETGGAVEAYLNGISAQVYLHNDNLRELINLTQMGVGSNSEIIQIMKNNLESVNVIKNTILDCLSSNRALRVELTN